MLASHVSALAQSPCEVYFTLGSDSLEITENSSCLPLRIEGSAEISSFQLGISFPSVDLQLKGINIQNPNISSISIVHHSNNDESVIALIWDNEEEVQFQEGEVVLELCFDVLSLAVEGYNVDIDGAMLDLGNIAKNNSQEFVVCANVGRIETPCSTRQFEVHPSFALNNKDRCRHNDTTTFLYPYELHDSADFPLSFQLYRFGVLDNEFVYNTPAPSEERHDIGVYNGDYKFIIQNGEGCIDSASFSIHPPIGDARNQVTNFAGHVISHTCQGQNDAFITEFGSAYPGDSGVWSNGIIQSFRDEFKFEIRDLSPGSYSLERHTGGCIASAFYEIENIPTYNVNYNSRFATCDGSDGSIWIETDPPGNYKYSWEGRSDTTAIIENLTPGSYQVTVTNPEGCEVERTIALPMTGYIQLEWESEVSFPDCLPGTKASKTISLNSNDITGVDFIWSTGEMSNGTSSTATQLGSGQQWVYAYTPTCASDTMFFEVGINEEFEVSIDDERSDLLACPGTMEFVYLNYDSTANPRFFDRFGIELTHPLSLPIGSHTITAASESGCSQIVDFEITSAEYQTGTDFIINGAIPDLLCPGEEVHLSIAFEGEQIDVFALLNGDELHEEDSILLTIGEYNLSLTNQQGCMWDTTFIIGERELDIVVPEDLSITEGQAIILTTSHDDTESLEYDWKATNTLSCNLEDCRSIIYNPLVSETIYLDVRNELGCSYEDSIVVTVIDAMEVDTVVIVNPPSADDFHIPNIISSSSSLNNEFCVSLTDVIQTVDFFALYDRWGNQVALASDSNSDRSVCLTESLSLQSQQLSSGVYVYVIQFTYVDGHRVSRSGNVTML